MVESLASGEHDALIQAVELLELDRVAVVGHEPHLSGLLSLLLTGAEWRMRTTFRKGAAALVAFESFPRAGDGVLEWLIQPGTLRASAHHPD